MGDPILIRLLTPLRKGRLFILWPNHKTSTLINVFREHVNTLPADVPIHYIMDNLNTHFNSESVEILQEIIEAFIDTWNKFFAHPFTWRYTGDGLFEKAISRFNKLLLFESAQMDIKFLTKQLLLMANIPKIYKNATQIAVWKQLRELSHSRSAFINNIINGTSKKQQKDRAVKALDQLASLLCLSWWSYIATWWIAKFNSRIYESQH